VPSEQVKVLEALKTAQEMEIQGKEFYHQASQVSTHKLGKELLKTLAAEEDVHRTVFKKIYDSIRDERGWPDVQYKSDKGQGLKTVFNKALKNLDKDQTSLPSELDAIKTGMDLENKTYDFYINRSSNALYDAEKQLYESIAMQEREHHRVLQDYYDYLQDPAQWYVKAEHTSVDGG
jgi:rubrerythrin